MLSQRWVKDNLEAIAIAVVMALVIRQFTVEAFKIPTESMAPTLFGERRGLSGDRILVDKIGPMLNGYKRWDVVVFKFPLNALKNYIKRLIGLPGERLSIRDGDIWIDGKIARKPPRVQDVLFFPVCPLPGDSDQQAGDRFDLPSIGAKRTGDRVFEVASSDGERFVLYGPKVRDVCPWAKERDGVYPVGDVRLSLTVRPLAPGGAVVIRIVENLAANDLVLSIGPGESFLRRLEERFPLAGVALSPDRDTEVSFANVDDSIQIEVDGKRFSYEYDGPGEGDHHADAVAFGVNQASARFTAPKLERDIYYERKGRADEITIPADRYFMLGDNSRHSKDSRVWNVRVFTMKDGTEYRFDDSEADSAARPGKEPGTLAFLDYEGVFRVIKESEKLKERSEAAPFVPGKNLVGRAFFVFWPFRFDASEFRPKFIR